MEKKDVDKIITEYLNKIYSFSLSKTNDIDSANDLASEILLEVYKSLLKAENIQNINSYIYRIAQNTYSRYVSHEKKYREIKNQADFIPRNQNSYKEKVHSKIRKKIAHLGKLQREIMVFYYYQKLSMKEISERIKIPEATVGWHLFDARNKIKEGFDEIDINPSNGHKKLFSKIGGHGYLGIQRIDIAFYLSKTLTQNIVYSAYHKPKSIVEIAKEIDIPATFVEDEIECLIDYGFINKMPYNKYQTNIFISDLKKETEEKLIDLYSYYANIVCKKYIPLLFDTMSPLLETNSSNLANKIYFPQNDYNFLMWTIVNFALTTLISKREDDYLAKFATKRIDGGCNIALVNIKKENTNNEYFRENTNLMFDVLTKNDFTVKAWINCSRYDNRSSNLVNEYSIWLENIYNYITKKFNKDSHNIEKYVSLVESSFLATTNRSESDNDFVNIIITTMTLQDLLEFIPDVSEYLFNLGLEMREKLYKIVSSDYPPQMQELCRLRYKNGLKSPYTKKYVIENLLKNNILKPLQKHQLKTVNMIMFSDVLPE